LYSKLFSIINLSLPRPDLLVYLYLSVDRLKSNIQKRGRPYELDIENEYLTKIQGGYFEYIRQQSDTRILIIDTNQLDFVNNAGHYQLIKGIIMKDYPLGIHTIDPF
jgi:deoxyadenosine/deoxycytidine kinase